MSNSIQTLCAVLVAAVMTAGTVSADPIAPSYGTFSDAAKEQARLEAEAERAAGPRPAVEWEAQDSHELETLLEESGRMNAPLRGGLNDDNDGTHYARGRSLIINIFVNHTGGTWSTTEKETMVARNAVAKDYYVDNAPVTSNLRFDNQGTNGYWEYTATVNYNIPEDGFTWDMTEDALADIGFADNDGDTFRCDDLTTYLQNWGGGWDNVLAIFQPADITGRAFASFALARVRQYTDDSANVRAHEWGHLFGECDEYDEGCSGCGPCQSTYLQSVVDNENCEGSGCATNMSCLMRYNSFNSLCPTTLQHWAWVDGDDNGQLDTVTRRVSGASFVNIYELWNGGWFLWNNTGHGMVYHQRWNSWSVAGVRSPPTADYDMRVYGDNNHNYLYASSSYAIATPVDFVVADHNHTPLGNDHVEIIRYSGDTANYRLGWESGNQVLYPDGVARAGAWAAEDVVKVWDVPLFAGETVSFVLDATSGAPNFGMSLFRSFGDSYYAGRSSAQWTRDAAGAGGTESWTYTVPATDVYGLVMFSNGAQAGNFTIKIGPTPASLSEETPFASALDLRLFNYDPNTIYWSFIGNRPAAGDNTTVRLFNESTYVTELEVSNNYNSASPNNADFIAVDYNHVSTVPDYVRVIRESGASVHRTEWEHDPDIMNGVEPTTMWDPGHVGKVWDSLLTAGVPYMLRSYSSGLDQGIYLFGSGGGDYYKERAAFEVAANFRPGSEGGEWFNFTPATTDWYGIVQIVNDEGGGFYSNWLGRRVTLVNDLATSYTDEVQWGSAAAASGDWHVFGTRPSPGAGAGIVLYGDSGYSASTFKAADLVGTDVVNYVVGDYNHTALETVYPRVHRMSGSGAVDVEFDSGTEQIIFLGGSPISETYSWPAGDVVEVVDVFLPLGQQLVVSLNTLTGSMDLGMALFRSNGATYYATSGSAVASADAQGAGGDESFTYNTTTADWYGLVVFNQNDTGGTYEVIIGNQSSTGVDVVAGATTFDLAAAPNPFVADADLQFSIPRDDRVSLAVYDVTGRLVRTLADETMAAGHYVRQWDGRDAAGGRVAAGVYLARLKTSQEEKVHKLIRVR